MSHALESLTSFPPITLADLDSSWTMARRYDTKFIVERRVMEQFLDQTTTSFAALEIAGKRAFTYRTTYFDTPDLLLYRDHAQGRSRRVKVRTRQYIESNRARLEVKAKLGNGQTQKTLFEGRSNLGPLEIPLIDQAIAQTYPTARYSDVASQLIQSAITTFVRSTIINQNSVERITFDSSLLLDSNGKQVQLLPELVLVEVKSIHQISDTVRELRQLGFHPTSFSKYCAGIESTHDFRPRIHSANLLSRKLCSVN
jgi:hypothetical protein